MDKCGKVSRVIKHPSSTKAYIEFGAEDAKTSILRAFKLGTEPRLSTHPVSSKYQQNILLHEYVSDESHFTRHKNWQLKQI